MGWRYGTEGVSRLRLNALYTHGDIHSLRDIRLGDMLNQLGKSPSLLAMLKLNAKSKITDTRN